MKEDVERGSVTLGELEKAVAAGTAISDEMLYMAVDKVIDFIGAIVRVRDVYGNSTADGDGEGENAPAPRPEDSGKTVFAVGFAGIHSAVEKRRRASRD